MLKKIIKKFYKTNSVCLNILEKRNLIIIINSFTMPLVEGNHRQAYEIAIRFSKKYNVKILSFTNQDYKLKEFHAMHISKYVGSKEDIFHFISPSVKLYLKTLFKKRSKTISSFLDGEIKGLNGNFPNLFKKLFNVDYILLCSSKQIPKLRKYTILKPFISNYKPSKKKF